MNGIDELPSVVECAICIGYIRERSESGMFCVEERVVLL